MVDPKVLIIVPTGEYARRADFYDYYNMMEKPENSMTIFPHDRSPAKARNMAIEEAFKHNCTHVLFIDDDMAYKPDALIKLLTRDLDVVSGLYLSRQYPHAPLVFDIADDNGACLSTYLTDNISGLIPIVAAGFGFILIKTDVFRKMDKPYIRLGELNSEEWCDDIGFFKRVREQVNCKMYCDTDVRLGHMGTMIVWVDKVKGKWLTGYDTGYNEMLMSPQIQPIRNFIPAEDRNI